MGSPVKRETCIFIQHSWRTFQNGDWWHIWQRQRIHQQKQTGPRHQGLSRVLNSERESRSHVRLLRMPLGQRKGKQWTNLATQNREARDYAGPKLLLLLQRRHGWAGCYVHANVLSNMNFRSQCRPAFWTKGVILAFVRHRRVTLFSPFQSLCI